MHAPLRGSNIVIRFITIIPLLLFSALAPAAPTSICVPSSSAAGLLSALSFGEAFAFSDGYIIKIEQGFYQLNSALLTGPVAFAGPTHLEGGYTPDSSCGSRSAGGPAFTVIDFGGTNAVFRQNQSAPSASLQFDNLTLQNAASVVLSAGRTNSFPTSDDTGEIRIGDSIITNVTLNATGGVVNMTTVDGPITIDNTQIDHIVQTLPYVIEPCAATFEIKGSGGNGANLTGLTMDLAGGHDFCVALPEGDISGIVYITNSIVWGSDGGVPHIRGVNPGDNLTVSMDHDLFHGFIGDGFTFTGNKITLDPQWVNVAAGNYRLKTSPLSPAINSGLTDPDGGLTAFDMVGNTRWVGSAPDIGAYESSVDDLTTLVVTSLADTDHAADVSIDCHAASPTCTLRQAIEDANLLPLHTSTIQFNIKVANIALCPAVIALGSALPGITAPIIIDGYTQPGSTLNNAKGDGSDDPNAFNGNLCVIVKPNSGTLATGLYVAAGSADAQLTVRGLGLGGFDQPIVIFDGNHHVIAGNQIGGMLHGATLAAAADDAILVGFNAGAGLIIGGTSVADRNIIGGGTFSGITISANVTSSPANCQIVNNLIGVAANGVTPVANGQGVVLSGTGCSVAANRIAGNNYDGIFLTGSGNQIQSNIIGVDIHGNGLFNNGYGIHSLGTGSGNTIGLPANSYAGSSTLFANTIRYMVKGGVLIDKSVVGGQPLRGNLIYDNGATGSGLDIDLMDSFGATGPTPNDASDTDSGANNLQNFPVAKSLTYAGAPPDPSATFVPATITASLNAVAATSYRADAYFSDSCDSGRGHAKYYLGSTSPPVSLAAGVNRASFALNVSLPNVQSSGIISLTATDATGHTSELGECFPIDTIFRDGAEFN